MPLVKHSLRALRWFRPGRDHLAAAAITFVSVMDLPSALTSPVADSTAGVLRLSPQKSGFLIVIDLSPLTNTYLPPLLTQPSVHSLDSFPSRPSGVALAAHTVTDLTGQRCGAAQTERPAEGTEHSNC